MLREIILWRHGETDMNKTGRIQGSTDVPLNDTGHAQAKQTAPLLASARPTRLYCSSLQRARQTAQYLGDLTGLEPIADARFVERGYGQWETLTATEIEQDNPEQYQRWQQGLEPIGVGVEARDACGVRFVEGLKEYAHEAELSDTAETLVITAHGGVIVQAIITLFGMRPSEWNGFQVMRNCCCAVLRPNPGRVPEWRLAAYDLGVL